MRKENLGFIAPLVIFFVITGTALFGTVFLSEEWISEHVGSFFSFRATQELGQKIIQEEKNGEEQLVALTFSDLFSGTGWINEEKTTMYHNSSLTAFTMSPHVEKGEAHFVSSTPVVSSSKPFCMNGKCGEIKGSDFIFDGLTLALPKEIEVAERTLAVDFIGGNWLLSGVIKKNEVYEIYTYSFDGSTFTPLCSVNPFLTSRYPGNIRFDGDQNNFIGVYGAYEGQGIQVINGSCIKIPPLLGMRLMGDGFIPEIITTKKAWYLWSPNRGQLRIFKLFKDNEGVVAGVADLSSLIFNETTRRAFFELKKDGEEVIVLNEYTEEQSGSHTTKTIIDNNFTFHNQETIISKNLNMNPLGKVRYAKITDAFILPGNYTVRLYLSNDGDEWREVEVGKEISFLGGNNTHLFWKAVFDAKGNPSLPPFFGQIGVEYKIKL